MRLRRLSLSLGIVALLAAPSSLWAQATYFTAPTGPGGTWDVYEFLGTTVTSGWGDSLNAATFPSPPQFGPTVTGSLASIHSGLENLYVHHVGGYGDVWIGLTDLPAFPGAAETGTPVDAARLKGFTGPGGTPGPGWVWTDGTPYDFMAWGGGEPNNSTSEGATHLRGDGLWNDHKAGYQGVEAGSPALKFVTKYPTHLATAPAGATNLSDVFGPVTTVLPKVDNMWTIREAYLGTTGTVDNLAQSIALNKNPGAATVRTYNAPELNILDSGGPGQFTGDSQLQVVKDGVVAAGAVDQIGILAQAKIVIPAGQGGDYTFVVNSDDGFRMTIAGQPFTNVVNGQLVNGSAIYSVGRGVADTFGHVNLAPGEYDLQVESWEGTGGAAWEVSAAKGTFTRVDPTVFRLVGHKGTGQQVTVGTDPVITNNVPTIYYIDPQTNGTGARGVTGFVPYVTDTPADDNDMAISATGKVHIATAGTYTFGFSSDDGARLVINGASFTNVAGAGGIGSVGGTNNAIVADFNTGDSYTIAQTTLAAGDYDVSFLSWERGGGAFAMALGMVGDVATNNNNASLRLLGDPSAVPMAAGGWTVRTSAPGGVALNTVQDTLDELVGVRTYTDTDGIPIAPFSGGGLADGDMNGDGAVNNLDIAPFSLGLTDPTAFQAAFPTVPLLTGDINSDGAFNNLDISPFAALLTGGPAAVPEPSTIVLAGLGLVALVGVARRRKA